MIITFVVSTTLVLGGMAIGRAIAKGLVPKGDEQDDKKADDAKAHETKAPEAPKPAPKKADASTSLDGFPCQLGDVVTRPGGDEAWLAGGIVFSEDVAVSRPRHLRA
jgi:hypothetical protein